MPYEESKSKKKGAVKRGSYSDKAGISKEDPVPHVDLKDEAKKYGMK